MLIILATVGLVQTDRELDNLTGIGTGVMLFANLPIIWIFSRQAMAAYRDYISRLDTGQVGVGHKPPSIEDLVSGRDVIPPGGR
jgi:AGCS family alanine or glycine:cation symporter